MKFILLKSRFNRRGKWKRSKRGEKEKKKKEEKNTRV